MFSRVGSQQAVRTFLANLDRTQMRQADLQEQLATGKKVNQPSDDPVGMGIALGIRHDLGNVAAWQQNIADSQSWLSATDNALGNQMDVIQRARELAVQAGNGTMSQDQRAQLATEVLSLRAQTAEVGNATLGGRYLFAGTATSQAPFATNPPAATLPVNTGALNREVGQGQVMAVNITADRLQGPGGATPDIFTTLTNLATAMQNGDINTISGPSLAELDAHQINVSALRGEVAAKVNRLELTSSRFESDDIARQGQLSSIEDADMAQTIMDLTQQETVLQASLSVGARIMQRSLLDFLS